jgi:hypothetical protein
MQTVVTPRSRRGTLGLASILNVFKSIKLISTYTDVDSGQDLGDFVTHAVHQNQCLEVFMGKIFIFS